jgi:hypothetical protein
VSQQKLLERLLSVLEQQKVDYMITGSVVSSLQGEPRATHDINIVIEIQISSIPALLEAFQPPRFYLSAHSIKEAIEYQSMFNLLDTTEGDNVDFLILTQDPFDTSRFARKLTENALGFDMKVSSPEDTILAKFRWAKLSGGSEKHFTDALRVYEVQHGNLDVEYLETWVIKLKLQDIWTDLKMKAHPIA